MKANRIIMLGLCPLLMAGTFTSCSSTSSTGYLGTMAGAEIGGTIGEAIGWLSTSRHDGPGKAMLGSVIGTVAGVVIGNQVVANAEKRTDQRNGSDRESRQQPMYDSPDYGYQTGGGYQREGGYQAEGGYQTEGNQQTERKGYQIGQENTYTIGKSQKGLSIKNVRFQDEDGDGRFSRYETLNVIYEVTNESDQAVDATLAIDCPEERRNLVFSPSTQVTIQPHKSIRYKAKVFMKNQVKSSQVKLKVSAETAMVGKSEDELSVRCK